MSPVKNYRKKVHVVQAIQWTPDNADEVLRWLGDDGAQFIYDEIKSGGELILYTLEGPYQVPFTWWIIKGIKGEFYPCEDEIFKLSYEDE